MNLLHIIRRWIGISPERPVRVAVPCCLCSGSVSMVLTWFLVVTASLAASATSTTSATSTNSAPPQAAPSARVDFSSFKIVAERNIFNVNRSGRQPSNSRERRRVAKVDSFTLVGTLNNEKGYRAFFDGSGADFRKDLACGDTLAGYKITDINLKGVKFERGDQKLEFRLGMQMRREDEGEWKLNTSGEVVAASSQESSASESASSSESNDILKRLMQQREQELK
jgi:hypothetical protein